MYETAAWSSNSCHLALVSALVETGHGFEEVNSPLFDSWPTPALPELAPNEHYGEPDYAAVDPFYLEFIQAVVSVNEGGLSYSVFGPFGKRRPGIADENRLRRNTPFACRRVSP